jgi:hypothetical protein
LKRAEGGEAEAALEQCGPGLFVRVHAMRGVLTFMAGMMGQRRRGAMGKLRIADSIEPRMDADGRGWGFLRRSYETPLRDQPQARIG